MNSCWFRRIHAAHQTSNTLQVSISFLHQGEAMSSALFCVVSSLAAGSASAKSVRRPADFLCLPRLLTSAFAAT